MVFAGDTNNLKFGTKTLYEILSTKLDALSGDSYVKKSDYDAASTEISNTYVKKTSGSVQTISGGLTVSSGLLTADNGLTVNNSGTFTCSAAAVFNSSVTSTKFIEKLLLSANSTGSLTLDCTNASVFYVDVTNTTSVISANFTNLTISVNATYTVAVVLTAAARKYITSINVSGSPVVVKFAGGSTNIIDTNLAGLSYILQTITFMRDPSNEIVCLSSVAAFAN